MPFKTGRAGQGSSFSVHVLSLSLSLSVYVLLLDWLEKKKVVKWDRPSEEAGRTKRMRSPEANSTRSPEAKVAKLAR